MKTEWFESWFDSQYYHILYSHRDIEEANLLCTGLVDLLQLKAGTSILDLACGEGRHSRSLFSLGMEVVGLDLSERSIKNAKQFETNSLQFTVGDMRSFKLNRKFDLILNLFTSFGYFKVQSENARVLESVTSHLRKGGKFMIDFLNTELAVKHLVETERITRNEIAFEIERTYNDEFIQKSIRVIDDDQVFEFEESVQSLSLEDFRRLLGNAGFEIVSTFGNYKFEEFNVETSPRLIILAQFHG